MEEKDRCWCGSMLKDKSHNCIGTRGRVEGLLAEIRLLHEAIDKSNAALEEAIKTKEERDRLRKALEEIYKNEGPGLDGSSENASGKIARLALEGTSERIGPVPKLETDCEFMPVFRIEHCVGPHCRWVTERRCICLCAKCADAKQRDH
jgi:hypothetical protein